MRRFRSDRGGHCGKCTGNVHRHQTAVVCPPGGQTQCVSEQCIVEYVFPVIIEMRNLERHHSTIRIALFDQVEVGFPADRPSGIYWSGKLIFADTVSTTEGRLDNVCRLVLIIVPDIEMYAFALRFKRITPQFECSPFGQVTMPGAKQVIDFNEAIRGPDGSPHGIQVREPWVSSRDSVRTIQVGKTEVVSSPGFRTILLRLPLIHETVFVDIFDRSAEHNRGPREAVD